jgi:transcriptional regulator of acetoin/glycerol metabolism
MMAQAARDMVIPPDGQDVAVNRLRFLTSERAEPGRVRPPILASWHRSRALDVAADRIELPYAGDPDRDTPLTRSAEPVLRRLHEQLSGQRVSIVLTDHSGLVLGRRTADGQLERYLDVVRLAPGFSYAEKFVGTNGIGTALEAGAPTEVFGHEHFAENLELLACAGAPIHDPISGRLVGVIDLTCWRRDAESLLLTLAKSTAQHIEQALLVASGRREFEVLQAYRQTCRRTTGIVFALTSDAVMLNKHAQNELEPRDQAALLAQAAEAGVALGAGRRQSLEVLLPTGTSARMYCHQVAFESQPAGLVVHVKMESRTPSTHGSAPNRMLLPGLVGDAPLWQRACHQIEDAVQAGVWLAVEGEAGVGKSAILRAVQLRRQSPTRRGIVLDAAAPNDAWTATVHAALAEAESVVITHVDELDTRASRALCAALDDAKRDRPGLQVAITRRTQDAARSADPLLAFFPTTATVPPLRLRTEDLAPLVAFFLRKLSKGGQLACSPEAMHLLVRATWPGNVRQLQELLQRVTQHRRSGVITPDDLPPELHAVSRRVLSALESMERDAIVRSLADADGNKVRAAKALGMSRATIYRKIHEFGIVTPG